jgi:hypothetical protein
MQNAGNGLVALDRIRFCNGCRKKTAEAREYLSRIPTRDANRGFFWTGLIAERIGVMGSLFSAGHPVLLRRLQMP